ncbi:MAG: CoA transferase [Dehalococcoidia bacterium]
MPNLPLEGIRLLDLSQVYAGPLAGRLLADMGAEVIRIESAARSTRGGPQPQPGAVYPQTNPGEQPYNRSAYYNELNRNKLAVSLNLATEQGKEIFRKLVEISDVVLENFTPRVMANFGLDYPVLSEINPAIIMVSISAYGQTGPYRDYVNFGRGIEAMAGLSSITGYPQSQPLGPGTAYADSTGGLHAAFAAMVALRQRRKTGRGQHIDLSLRESLAPLLGEQLLDYSMNKRTAEPSGNHDPTAPFQRCFRCRGDDAWIAIAIGPEEEWAALSRAIGNPLDKNEDPLKLRRLIEDWTAQHEPNEAMETLQKFGVRAGAVLDAGQLNDNPHLKERGFFEMVTHPEAGTHEHPGMPWKLSRTPGSIRLPAPCFAEHNDYVFGELLGMSAEKIAELEESGVIDRRPRR